MARSHPPTLLKTLDRTMREECAVSPGARVMVAVSGGGDSMALLDALSKRAARLRIDIVAHGVDHGLRPEASRELDQAASHAQKLGVPFSRTELNVPAGGNLQHRARVARYDALRAAARSLSADHIATAHHAVDRAETLLLRLLRGAGPKGLSVLPARAEDLIRPMLRVRKEQVRAHLSRHNVPFADDPSNQDGRFLRVRVRRELLPLLEQLSPGIVGHLNALADQLTNSPLEAVTDPNNLTESLNRAQLNGIKRAKDLHQRHARIRLPGGREIAIEPSTGMPILVE